VLENPTELCKYKSRYGGGWLTGAKFIAEGMVARLARKEGVDLPQKFWDLPRWKRHFFMQLRHAYCLTKLYSIGSIIAALRTPKGKKVYSLGAQFILDPLIKVEQEKLAVAKQLAEANPVKLVELPKEVFEPARPVFVEKPNMLSKLRKLD
jgi:sulfur relay (sulfurtransferase) DsrC/TusE family protein